LQAVRRNEKLAASILRQLREGPTPSICAVDSEEWHGDDGYDPADDDDLPELCLDSEDNDDEEDDLEEGDRILYTVFTPIEEIHAGSTISQRLAEAYAQNSVPAGTNVLSCAADFSDVFNKESFKASVGPRHRTRPGCEASQLQGLPDLPAQTEGA
jgi:hypothetical protein